MSERNFFAELKRRNVYKVAVAYAVVAWLLIQLASILFPTFEAPAWVMKVFVAVVALGFPLALLFAWAFELTPEGIKRTEDVAHDETGTRRTGRKLVAGTAAIAAIAAGLLLFQFVRSRQPASLVTSSVSPPAGSAVSNKSIAVLPFENLSDDKANAYFASGIQDEILTKLASIADLKVISRTSTAKYQSKPENLKIVAQELGAVTILEGSVQKAADRVRVNVQLIDARADAHLWAKTYDGDAKDIFAVQSEVSQQVADALRAKLSQTETRTLAKAPTQDPEAYDLFLKGEYEQKQGEIFLAAEWFERATQYHEQAVARDPKFGLAAARLAESRLSLHFYSRPFSPAELDGVKAIIDRALALDPELPDAHVALGLFYYWGHLEYDRALVEFGRALDVQPNNARALAFRGYVFRRQGKWKESLAELAKAETLDPRDAQTAANNALTYTALRLWSDAKRVGAHALALDPHSVAAERALMIAAIHGDGDVASAKKVIANVPVDEKLIGNLRGGLVAVIDYRPYLSVLERDFEAASRSVPNPAGNEFDQRATLAGRAAIRALAGAAADRESEEARDLLESRLRQRPDDNFAMTQLSWVYLALGRNADAVRLAQQAGTGKINAAVAISLRCSASPSTPGGRAA